MSIRAQTILFLLATGCACGPTFAAMYRWVDEQGVTVYSQTPPPSGEAVSIKPQAGPSTEEGAAAQARLKTQAEQSFDAEEDKQKAAQEANEKAEQEAKRRDQCTAARHNLGTLRNLGTRMVHTPDGRYVRLSEDEVATQVGKAQGQVDDYCD